MKNLKVFIWERIVVRNTAKDKLTGEYHFAKVFICNKSFEQIESRMLRICRMMSANNSTEIKYSINNANLEQSTQEGLEYKQAQVFLSNIASKNQNKYWGKLISNR